MNMTVADFDQAVLAFVNQKIVPGIQDPFVLFAMGAGQNILLGKAHEMLSRYGFMSGDNVNVEAMASAIRNGFSMVKTLPLVQFGIPCDIEASDGESFIKEFLKYDTQG